MGAAAAAAAAVCVCMEARPSKYLGLACVVASVELYPRLVLLRSSLQQDQFT